MINVEKKNVVFENEYVSVKEVNISSEHKVKRVSFIPFGHLILLNKKQEKICLLKESFSDPKEDLGYFLPEVRLFSNVKEYQHFFQEENVEKISAILLKRLKNKIPIDDIFFYRKTETGSIIHFDFYYFWSEIDDSFNFEDYLDAFVVWKSYDGVMSLCLECAKPVFYDTSTVAVLLSFIINQRKQIG